MSKEEPAAMISRSAFNSLLRAEGQEPIPHTFHPRSSRMTEASWREIYKQWKGTPVPTPPPGVVPGPKRIEPPCALTGKGMLAPTFIGEAVFNGDTPAVEPSFRLDRRSSVPGPCDMTLKITSGEVPNTRSEVRLEPRETPRVELALPVATGPVEQETPGEGLKISPETSTQNSDVEVLREKLRSLLREAEECVAGDRLADYGSPSENFGIWVDLCKALGYKLTAVDLCKIQICGKLSRSVNREKRDNPVDTAGYAALWGFLLNER